MNFVTNFPSGLSGRKHVVQALKNAEEKQINSAETTHHNQQFSAEGGGVWVSWDSGGLGIGVGKKYSAYPSKSACIHECISQTLRLPAQNPSQNPPYSVGRWRLLLGTLSRLRKPYTHSQLELCQVPYV